MFKAKEGINIGGKVVTGSGPTAALTVGDVGTLAFQNSEGASIDYLIVSNKLGVGVGVEAPTYELDMIMSKPGANLVQRIYNKSTTASTKSILQLSTGTANNSLSIEYQDAVGATLALATGAPSLYVNATTHQFRTQAAGNVLQITDGNLTLQNATSNKIKFGTAGVAAPTFTTYSAGAKVVLYDNVGASNAGYAIGIESNAMWSSVGTTSNQFKWYGGTTLACTLTGTGDMTLVGDLTVSGGDITAGNVAATLFGGNTTTNITIGGAVTSGNITIGATAATGYANIYGVSGMRVPSGTTAQQPVAATAGVATIRYNTTLNQFEGVSGGTPAWLQFLNSNGTIANGSIVRANGSHTLSAATGSDITAAIGTNAVTNATNLNGSGTITDTTTIAATGVKVGYRNVPRSTTSGTAVVGDVGKCIAATAGITMPASTFAAGDAVSIYNDSASSITITQGASLTLRQAGTTNTGNRTLAARGMCTVWFNSATEAIISGAGIS